MQGTQIISMFLVYGNIILVVLFLCAYETQKLLSSKENDKSKDIGFSL